MWLKKAEQGKTYELPWREVTLTHPVGKTSDGVEVWDKEDSHLHAGVSELLQEALDQVTVGDATDVVKTEVKFPKDIGVSHLVETTEEDDIYYAARPPREDESRMVRGREPVPTKSLTVMVYPLEEGKAVLLTAYLGSPSPREPVGEFADDTESKEFWATHALIEEETEKKAWLKKAEEYIGIKDLNISFNEMHGSPLILAPWDGNQYVTEIGSFKIGMGTSNGLGNVLEKVQERFPDGQIPKSLIKVIEVPTVSAPVERRLGKQFSLPNPIQKKLDDQRKRYWLRETTPYGWESLSGTTTERAYQAVNRPSERWWYVLLVTLIPFLTGIL